MTYTQMAILCLSGLAVGACPMIPAVAADSSTSTVTTTTVVTSGAFTDDDRQIRSQAADYARIYAARDARALAAMWTDDGTFTDSRGQEHVGRAAIEAYFKDGFASGASQTLVVNVQSIKFPAPNVAIEEGTTRISSGPGLGSMGRYLVVHTKIGGKWLMQSCAETDCNATNTSEYLNDLGWLIGSWSIKDQPQAAHLKVSWSSNKTFIICRYIIGDAKDAPVDELQIIGWDPHTAQIVTWHFGSRGGFGSGSFSCDGKTWTEHAHATEPDGSTGRAHYRLTKLDDNSFTWQSLMRVIGGQQLPDSKALLISRDSAQ